MTDEEDSAITFETFRKFQRKEKKNEKLQELPEDFFQTCVDWISEKQEKFQENGDSAVLKEMENVKSIVKDIFERRRKKILLLALHSVRSKKVSENLLPEEKEFFERIVENLRNLEENLLERVLEGKEPDGEEGEESEVKEQEEISEEQTAGEEKEEDVEGGEDVVTHDLNSEDGDERVKVESGEGEKLLKITEPVDRFMGTDDKDYGPLERGDLVTLPEDVAELLLEREKAEESEL